MSLERVEAQPPSPGLVPPIIIEQWGGGLGPPVGKKIALQFFFNMKNAYHVRGTANNENLARYREIEDILVAQWKQ